ncbi:MAG: L-seryl-tRNA(Sec) selenium transferase [Fuerstiella sp.]|jgi:L-seryl-tRNA(Ser) seleniumtransferase|nr:L-seryl-tRNA(Sec) selenium transferase [Fuerstiella sp.]
MPSAQYLRSLPAVDHVLRHPLLLSVTTVFPRQQIVAWIRQSVDACRAAILAGEELDAKAATDFVVHQVLKFSQIEDGRRQQPVINATGILLHTNLGRAPLAARAVERMKESSGYANVEMNLQTGKRNKRGERVCELLRQLTGAEDAAVVNNCAAATMLVLQTLAAGKEVIVSRGQLVEIGGGFRLPEVFSASGAMLTEIGTTNRTYLGDYQDAITENTGAIIRVHRSNFFQGGFVTEPDIADLVALGLERNVPVVDDVGSGCMQDLTTFGLREPTVPDSVAAGADLTLFSGDKLFGGPQAGIIVGKSQWIEALRQNPMMRALRVDKMTLAAVEATAEIHMAGTTSDEIPLTQMMSRTTDELRRNSETLRNCMSVPEQFVVETVECISEVGGGSVPGSQIPGYGLRITGHAIQEVAIQLRCGKPAVLCRINDDAVLLDIRTVNADQLEILAERLSSALAGSVAAPSSPLEGRSE